MVDLATVADNGTDVLAQDNAPAIPKHPVDYPKLDVSGISWSESMDIAIVGAKVRESSSALSGADVEALKALRSAMEEFIGVVAKTIVELPRAWLVKDAPEKIKWSADTIGRYLRPAYMQWLIADITEATYSTPND